MIIVIFVIFLLKVYSIKMHILYTEHNITENRAPILTKVIFMNEEGVIILYCVLFKIGNSVYYSFYGPC